MELLYPEEHVSCFNYDKNIRPTIETINLRQGEDRNIYIQDHKLVFVLEGSIKFSSEGKTDEVLSKGKIALFSSHSDFYCKAEEDSYIMVVRLRDRVRLCDRYSLENLIKDNEKNSDSTPVTPYLDINSVMWDFLRMLNERITEGLRCFYFFEIKIKEMFFLFRAYYPREELFRLFLPLLSRDTTFSDFILQNYHKAKTVKELAELANYSLSGFEKHFKRTFGISAGQWLNRQRAMRIYHEINCSTKTFKTISTEYGFSSPAHLNDYCKYQFGETPGSIRKNNNPRS